MEHAGKLHTNDTCTDDAEALGERFEIQQPGRVNDTRVVTACNRKPFGFRTGGDDDVLGGVGFLACENHGDSPHDLRYAAITGTVPMIFF